MAEPIGGNAAKQLRAYVERIENLDEQRKALSDDRKEVLSEARGVGFDSRVINYIIKLRKSDPADLDEFDSLVDVYKRAIESAKDEL